MDVREANELKQALRERGVDDATIASAIAVATEAKERALSSPISLTANQYSELRAPMADYQRGAMHRWPADAQTVMKRLGKGYWSDAMSTLGLVPNIRGRGRGLLLFDEDSYEKALQNYVADRKSLETC